MGLGVVVGLLDKIFSNKVKTKAGSYKSGQKKYEGNVKNGKNNFANIFSMKLNFIKYSLFRSHKYLIGEWQ